MKTVDVAIVGAGPAGIAAALAARSQNASSVAIIDDNPVLGGQIWRAGVPTAWQSRIAKSGVEFLAGARIVDGRPAENLLLTESPQTPVIPYSKLILATGARELFLPFPGWTLPNVFGVGGLQALAKSGLSVKGKRVIVAGSGPLLLAVAAYLKKHGAHISLIAEQQSLSRLVRFSKSLLRYPGKVAEAVQLKLGLAGVSYLTNCWITKAIGTDNLQTVELIHQGQKRQEPVDFLAIGYGFVPNTELAQLLGCKLNGGFVSIDTYQQTSLPNVYCAGEPTGIGGIDKSLLEGHIAGLAATGVKLDRNRSSIQFFSQQLNSAFELRQELRELAADDTIICRCEDVTFGRIRHCRSWREAKLHHRCGMGPCQGRVCGPITEFLLGWKQDSIRPPLFPSTVQTLLSIQETTHI